MSGTIIQGTGPLEGFRTWGDDDPFEAAVGPFFLRQLPDGSYRSAFMAEDRHANAGGVLHGGALMSFADFTAFVIAKDHMKDFGVTVSLNCDFVAGAAPGCLYYGKGVTTRTTRSLIFVRGEIYNDAMLVLTFTGILKIPGKKR